MVIISTHILIQPNSSIKYNSSPLSSGPNRIPDHSHHDGQSQILTSAFCGVPVFSGGWRRGGARVVPVTEVGYNILSTFKSVIVARTQDPGSLDIVWQELASPETRHCDSVTK